MDYFLGGSEAERDFQRRVWESQRAITGEGESNPFEIFRQRGEYIDRTQNGGGLEPWEFGYTEPPQENERSFLERLLGTGNTPEQWENLRTMRERSRGSLGSVSAPDRPGAFGIEWGSFFLRTIYVILGIILLGIGAAALANNAGAIPLGRTLRAAQRFAS